MALLSDRDARAWHALASRISETIEPRLATGVLANRTISDAGSRELLAPALNRAATAANLLTVGCEVVIRTDVREFYPSVTPSVAFRSLVDMDVPARVAGDAARMLEGWGSEGYRGLPIGPPGSAVIANTVLASVDRELSLDPFLRWVDDYLIGLDGEPDVPRMLDRLDSALERVGLERSRPKTHVLSGGRVFAWPGTYRGPGSSE